jgi:hypothetical protein
MQFTARSDSVETDVERIITADFPMQKYASPARENLDFKYFWYYRRELIEEIEFLTLSLDSRTEPFTLLVIGAAPGYDLITLLVLFPDMKLIVFDPKQICPELKSQSKRVSVYEKFFEDADAHRIKAELAGQLVFMQCYTRIESGKLDENLERVKNWHHIIKPKRGAYEFTLPYNSDASTLFIEGERYFPVWSKEAGSDCRLITAEYTDKETQYSHRTHEEQMMHFNTVYRLNSFKYEGKNLSYDEFTEMKILENYVRKFEVDNTPDILYWCITEDLSPFPMKPDWWKDKIRHMGRTPPDSVTGKGTRPRRGSHL